MKRIIALLFLTIYLVSSTELYQLLKFPVLVEHFIEHKEKTPGLSIVDFLVLHYHNHLEDHPHDDDFEQDQKLPFMVHTDVLSFCFIYEPPLSFQVKSTFAVAQPLMLLPFDDTFQKDTFLSTIWQPPKFA